MAQPTRSLPCHLHHRRWICRIHSMAHLKHRIGTSPMKLDELKRVFNDIKYKSWEFHIGRRLDSYTLQIQFWSDDSETGEWRKQHCRKWFISKHACRAEVVRTAWKAVVAAAEHEVSETFRYKGVAIHSPHLDPDALARLYKNEKRPLNRRKN